MDCMQCGLGFDHAPDRLYDDGEQLECSDCHSKNVVSVDEDEAYLSYYICRHGKHDDEPCDLCEIEDGGGVGEV